MQKVSMLLNRLYSFEKFVCALGFAVMTTLVLLDIGSREIFSTSITWAQKSAVYLMIWLGFMGASLTSANGGHLRPEMADQLWKGKTKTIIQFLEQAVIALFCLGMASIGFEYILESRTLGDVSVFTGLPMWILQLAIPYSFFSMGLRHAAYAIIPALKPVRSPEEYQ